ncbi:MAG: energy-coupling factor ABC transporter ATP-binding protein [Clostridiales bacterium]|nr:energy-coupling factor ABC transporter ATP-binding protein [Clostridiales bacterium]
MTVDAIEFKNVKFAYPSGSFELSIKSLALDMGQATFIRGENGSGKTTLARLMAGILKPQEGEITIVGTPSFALGLGEIGKRVGYLWQNPRQQLFAKSVIEELTFVEELKNPKMTPGEKAAAKEAAMGWLEYFELAQLKDKTCYHLSHGERQRLALAAVIASGAKYLVLDEPTAGLDDKRKMALACMLKKLRLENGTGMSVISHDEKFAGELTERAITLAKGEVSDVQS